MAKKVNTKKTTKKSAKKEVDINDIDSLVDDVKKLALEKPKTEKKEKVITETVKDLETDDVKVYLRETIEIEKEAETDDKELKLYVEPVTIITHKTTDDKDDDEDLSFIDEVKAEETLTVEEPKEERPKRKITYQEMFGGTWMGYGYSE